MDELLPLVLTEMPRLQGTISSAVTPAPSTPGAACTALGVALELGAPEQPDGSMLFHPLPAPRDEDVARLARAVCRKVTRYLGQLTGEGKDQQLTLDHLANASMQGLVATGPRRGCRVLRLGGTGEDAEAAAVVDWEIERFPEQLAPRDVVGEWQ